MLVGEEGKDGVIYIFTIKYAKNGYWNYFRGKSEEYKRLVPSPESDSTVQYILNKRILTEKFEGGLFLINDELFKSIRFLNKDILKKEYNVTNKEFGFQIVSDRPEDLYKGKKKF